MGTTGTPGSIPLGPKKTYSFSFLFLYKELETWIHEDAMISSFSNHVFHFRLLVLSICNNSRTFPQGSPC